MEEYGRVRCSLTDLMPKGKKKKVPPGEGYLGVLSIGRACPYPAPQKMGHRMEALGLQGFSVSGS